MDQRSQWLRSRISGSRRGSVSSMRKGGHVTRVRGPLFQILLGGAVVAIIAAGPASAGREREAAEGSKVLSTLKLRAVVDLTQLASASATSGSGANDTRRSIPLRPVGAVPNVALAAPRPSYTARAPGHLPGFRPIDGLNHRDQRYAHNGQQFSLEPPDQGLCTGQGAVLEAVNDALMAFDTAGNQLLVAPVTENQFNAFADPITRADPTDGGGPPFGPYV